MPNLSTACGDLGQSGRSAASLVEAEVRKPGGGALPRPPVKMASLVPKRRLLRRSSVVGSKIVRLKVGNHGVWLLKIWLKLTKLG